MQKKNYYQALQIAAALTPNNSVSVRVKEPRFVGTYEQAKQIVQELYQ